MAGHVARTEEIRCIQTFGRKTCKSMMMENKMYLKEIGCGLAQVRVQLCLVLNTVLNLSVHDR
jgi:hypothetical protein